MTMFYDGTSPCGSAEDFKKMKEDDERKEIYTLAACAATVIDVALFFFLPFTLGQRAALIILIDAFFVTGTAFAMNGSPLMVLPGTANFILAPMISGLGFGGTVTTLIIFNLVMFGGKILKQQIYTLEDAAGHRQPATISETAPGTNVVYVPAPWLQQSEQAEERPQPRPRPPNVTPYRLETEFIPEEPEPESANGSRLTDIAEAPPPRRSNVDNPTAVLAKMIE